MSARCYKTGMEMYQPFEQIKRLKKKSVGEG